MARDADGPDPQKRQPRKPPTFRHLPEQRAKKLKQQWVLKQKIKSQWKAQKRKEGIVTLRDARIAATKRDDMEAVSGSSTSARHARDAIDSGNGDSSAEEDGASNNEASDESEPQQAQQPHAPPARSQASRKTRSDEPPQPASSYRDLQRQAYSRESLHHFKSGRGGKSARGGGGARDRGRGRGRGGQPDMRLRMNAMLEKIKHTVSEK